MAPKLLLLTATTLTLTLALLAFPAPASADAATCGTDDLACARKCTETTVCLQVCYLGGLPVVTGECHTVWADASNQ